MYTKSAVWGLIVGVINEIFPRQVWTDLHPNKFTHNLVKHAYTYTIFRFHMIWL